MPVTPYGLLAAFDSPTRLVEAVRCARRDGYEKLEAFTPFPVEGLREELGRKRWTWVPAITFVGAAVGTAIGYAVQYYANVVDYPINVGGRPLNSWPAFVVVTFEVAVLAAALAAVVGMLALNGLPRPHHPVFDVPEFDLATQTRFFLCIRATDPRFDPAATRGLLTRLEPLGVWEVPQ